MGTKEKEVIFNAAGPVKIKKLKVREGMPITFRQLIMLYEPADASEQIQLLKYKANDAGTVKKVCVSEGDVVMPGQALLLLEECTHPTVMKDMCAECGADLRQDDSVSVNASVPMVHSIPELKVSEELAQILGKADETRLLKDRKLVLLVDLDQTLIHTTNDNIPPNLKDVVHFQLYGPQSQWYHTRIRPGTEKFLEAVSKFYELHICTFGARNYAHYIAMFLDPDGRFFSHRILSRDECFDANSKTANLRALFPCGDSMVCIIDDREDVWNYAPNLIHVKPYHFFQHTGDINAPPGLTKKENDTIEDGFDFTKLGQQKSKEEDEADKKVSSGVGGKKKTAPSGETTTDKDTEDEKDAKPTKVNSYRKSDATESYSDLSQLNDTLNKECLENGEKGSGAKLEEKGAESNKQLVENSETKITHKEKEEPEETDLKGKESDTDVCKEEKVEKMKEEELKEKTPQDLKESVDILPAAPLENTPETPEVKSISTEVETTASPIVETNQAINEEKVPNSVDDDVIEVEDSDDYLLHLEDILKKVHSEYYMEYDKLQDKSGPLPDLKEVIPRVKGEILAGCHLVFSGLVPSHVPLSRSRAYAVAVSLGATVSAEVTAETTHLVAARAGTAKVNSSRRQKGVHIVTPQWLWHCAERWEKVDERLYPLARGVVTSRHPPAHCGSPQHPGELDTTVPAPRPRTDSGRFIDTINPLLSFSSEDMEIMDQEVEALCADDDDSESEAEIAIRSPVLPIVEPDSSSSDSLTADSPKGWTEESAKGKKRKLDTTTCTESDLEEDSPVAKFRRGEPLPSDLDLGENSQEDTQDSEEDADDSAWTLMGAALEREFLSGD